MKSLLQEHSALEASTWQSTDAVSCILKTQQNSRCYMRPSYHITEYAEYSNMMTAVQFLFQSDEAEREQLHVYTVED